MTEPVASVIVPAWNAAATLLETLTSVARQSLRDFEIIIVDDGSEDDTAEIAAAFCRFDSRARLIRQANGGVAAARNTGIRAARARYIAPIDADDMWHELFLDRLTAALDSDVQAALAYALSLTIDSENRVLGCGFSRTLSGRAWLRILLCNPLANGSSAVFRRSAWRAAQGYDTRLHERGTQGCEDWLLALRFAATAPIVGIDEFLVGYRVLGTAMSRNVARMAASEALMRELAACEFGMPPPPPFVARHIEGALALKQAWGCAQASDWAGACERVSRAAFADPMGAAVAIYGKLRRLLRRSTIPSAVFFDPAAPVSAKPPSAIRPSLYMRLQWRRMEAITHLEPDVRMA